MTSTSIAKVVIDSITFHVLLEGPRQGPVIVLIHALMASHRIWDSLVSRLHAAGYRTLRYDHVGHNSTSPPADPSLNQPGRFDFDIFVRHLRHIINTVLASTAPPYAVIGCSIGGVLALRYHMLYPPSPAQTTRTKIISCAMPGMTSIGDSKPKWRARINHWENDKSVDNLALETFERWFPQPLPPDFDRMNALRIIKSCSLDGYKICAWATMNFDYTEQCDRIKDGENILILVGETDGNIGPREVMLDVHDRIKGSTYVMMDDTGHIPPLHWPEKFASIVLDFLVVKPQAEQFVTAQSSRIA